jgi:cell wall integrity and stress response component
MKFSTSNIAVTASTLLLWAPRMAAAVDYSALEYVDCYSSVPGFIDNGTYTYQSQGYCQKQCAPMGYSVMALLDGKDCYCGNELPPNSTQTTGCDTTCDGYNLEDCENSPICLPNN